MSIFSVTGENDPASGEIDDTDPIPDVQPIMENHFATAEVEVSSVHEVETVRTDYEETRTSDHNVNGMIFA